MNKKILALSGFVLLLLAGLLTWGSFQEARLLETARACEEQQLCLNADSFSCMTCGEIKRSSTNEGSDSRKSGGVAYAGEVNANGQTMWAGSISKVDVTTYQYGTHVLRGRVLDGNATNYHQMQTYALRSNVLDLDEWTGRAVIVTGKKADGYPLDGGPVLIEVTAIEPDNEISIR